jgi:hypothetical protein
LSLGCKPCLLWITGITQPGLSKHERQDENEAARHDGERHKAAQRDRVGRAFDRVTAGRRVAHLRVRLLGGFLDARPIGNQRLLLGPQPRPPELQLA